MHSQKTNILFITFINFYQLIENQTIVHKIKILRQKYEKCKKDVRTNVTKRVDIGEFQIWRECGKGRKENSRSHRVPL